MKFRPSIDTLYFGVSIDTLMINDFLREINNYLFFYRQINYRTDFCRNRFYREEAVCEDNGFYMFLLPRKGCQNPTITIQLGGKFFRNINESKLFVNWLLDSYFEFLTFQRVDVALDVLYFADEFIDLALCESTNTKGFPFPHYSKEWKNRRIEFDMNTRIRDDVKYSNCVSCGKNDLRLRIYDKTLDLLEKYQMSYHTYYELLDKVIAVYRIELQARGDKLKIFVGDCLKDGEFKSYNSICKCFLSYLFKKYYFEFVNYDDVFKDFDSNFNHKRDSSTLEGRIIHHDKVMKKEYRVLCGLYDELRMRDDLNVLSKNMTLNFIRCVDNPIEYCKNDIIDFYKLKSLEKKQEELPF